MLTTVCCSAAVHTSPGLHPDSQRCSVMSSQPHHCNQTCFTHLHTQTVARFIPPHYQTAELYGGRRNMNNVRTEQTPLWFHSTDSLINRNVLAWNKRERKQEKGWWLKLGWWKGTDGKERSRYSSKLIWWRTACWMAVDNIFSLFSSKTIIMTYFFFCLTQQTEYF